MGHHTIIIIIMPKTHGIIRRGPQTYVTTHA